MRNEKIKQATEEYIATLEKREGSVAEYVYLLSDREYPKSLLEPIVYLHLYFGLEPTAEIKSSLFVRMTDKIDELEDRISKVE